MSERFRCIRGYDDGTESYVSEESKVKMPLERALNTLVRENEVVITVHETRLGSGNAFYTLILEDMDFRFPSPETTEDQLELDV